MGGTELFKSSGGEPQSQASDTPGLPRGNLEAGQQKLGENELFAGSHGDLLANHLVAFQAFRKWLAAKLDKVAPRLIKEALFGLKFTALETSHHPLAAFGGNVPSQHWQKLKKFCRVRQEGHRQDSLGDDTAGEALSPCVEIFHSGKILKQSG